MSEELEFVDVSFSRGLEVYSVARKRYGYVVRIMKNITTGEKIITVRFYDNREVVLFVFTI